MENSNRNILRSVENTLSVLDLFGVHEELGVSEVANLMGIGKSTAFRILTTLEVKKYLIKLPNMKYCLGIKLFSLGHIVKERHSLKAVATPYLKKLSEMTGETAHLVVWYDEQQVIFIDKYLSKSAISMKSFIGFIMPAHLTASGKVLLSGQTEDQLLDYAESVSYIQKTDYTIMNKEDLIKEINMIRENGYAIDREESEIGLICNAAPIIDHTGQTIGALSTSGPAHRMLENTSHNIHCVMEVAKEISDSL